MLLNKNGELLDTDITGQHGFFLVFYPCNQIRVQLLQGRDRGLVAPFLAHGLLWIMVAFSPLSI